MNRFTSSSRKGTISRLSETNRNKQTEFWTSDISSFGHERIINTPIDLQNIGKSAGVAWAVWLHKEHYTTYSLGFTAFFLSF